MVVVTVLVTLALAALALAFTSEKSFLTSALVSVSIAAGFVAVVVDIRVVVVSV